MSKLVIDVKKCSDFHCPYLFETTVYPPDSFEMPYDRAKCKHPENNGTMLGTSDDDDYCDIPESCPLCALDDKCVGSESLQSPDIYCVYQYKDIDRSGTGTYVFIQKSIEPITVHVLEELKDGIRLCADLSRQAQITIVFWKRMEA